MENNFVSKEKKLVISTHGLKIICKIKPNRGSHFFVNLVIIFLHWHFSSYQNRSIPKYFDWKLFLSPHSKIRRIFIDGHSLFRFFPLNCYLYLSLFLYVCLSFSHFLFPLFFHPLSLTLSLFSLSIFHIQSLIWAQYFICIREWTRKLDGKSSSAKLMTKINFLDDFSDTKIDGLRCC